MTKRQDRDAIYTKRQFDTEIIVLCVCAGTSLIACATEISLR